MELTQAKPRKRRRWLILAVLLFVVSTVSWWKWPRGDARFVGKWDVTETSTLPMFDGRWFSPRQFVVVLYSNGSGISLDRSGQKIRSFSWEVRDRVFREAAPTLNDSVNWHVSRLQNYMPQSVQRIPCFSFTGKLEMVTTDGITLSMHPNSSRKMQRIPE